MSEYLTLLPEPQVMGTLKKPYDTEFHKVLRSSTEIIMQHIPGNVTALVTDRAVYIVGVDIIPLRVISYFTAHINRMWNGRGLLIFSARLCTVAIHSTLLANERERVIAFAKLSYEMYIEEHRFDLENGLFPEYILLPYEKTPDYYQRGIILTK